MDSVEPPVGLAGLGLVGAAMAARLLAAGRAVLGWDPDPTRRSALVAAGGTAAEGPARLGRDCTTVLVATFDAEQASDVLASLPQGGVRSTVVGVTTCVPDDAVRLGREAAARGWFYVEFPLSGTSSQIAGGTATGLLGAAEGVAACIAPVLEIVCPHYCRVGCVGKAAAMKLAVNLVLQLNRAALAEGIVFAERLGLDPRAFLDVAQGSAAASAVMATKGRKMIERDFTPDSRIAQTSKDAGLILSVAAGAGQTLPLMQVQAGLLQVATAGGSDRDSAAVIEAIRALNQEGHPTG